MKMLEVQSPRALKLSKQIQRDISDIFIKDAAHLVKGKLVSVTVVRMSTDLSLAKVYLSVFPFENHKEVIEAIQAQAWSLRMLLAKRMKNQIKSIPEVAFFLDDSMEYAEGIDSVLSKIKIEEV